jgi:hypothetical protein
MWELKKSQASKVDVDITKLMLSSSISCRQADPVGAVLADFAIDCRTLILPPPRGNAVASI